MIFSMADFHIDPTPPQKNHTKMLKSEFFLQSSFFNYNFVASIVKLDANKRQERGFIQEKRPHPVA
jgi:hypothetical protein